MISVIIPTYKEPEALDLCLKSAILGQKQDNQIIVVVDGFYDINKEVIENYKDKINVLDLQVNMGLTKATNLGVYTAQFDKILIVNDDNVFPYEWDNRLLDSYRKNSVIAPNQIEPIPSIFKQFVIEDLGGDPITFDLQLYWNFESKIKEHRIEQSGNTLPIFMSKKDYLMVGGWDESYPGAWVVDWDFFLKCELAGLKMLRSYHLHFYHFVSIVTETIVEEDNRKQIKERECHEYFKYKWGCYAQHNPQTNSKLIEL